LAWRTRSSWLPASESECDAELEKARGQDGAEPTLRGANEASLRGESCLRGEPSFGAVRANDIDMAIGAPARHAHPPGIAANFAVLDEAALDVRLEIDFHLLAAVGTHHEEQVFHARPTLLARVQ
jgi:hypothetical protein